MPGQNDLWPWLQSILQNQGAGQPVDPNAIPGAAPQAMPGSGLNGMPAMTPGQPSMGYPAQGALGAQPQPPQPPPPAPDDDHGTGPPAVMSPAAMYQAQYGGPTAAADAAHAPPSAPFVQPQHPSTMRYPMWPTPPAADAPAGSPSATPQPAGSGKGPLATSGGGGAAMKRTPGAPNLGYYQPNNRFVQVDRPNASAAGGFGRGGPPQMTALNLAGLFGGGQQPAASPANVPAANAQPVSANTGYTPGVHEVATYPHMPWPGSPPLQTYPHMPWPESVRSNR